MSIDIIHDHDGVRVEVDDGAAKDMRDTDLVCPLCGKRPGWLVIHYDVSRIRTASAYQLLTCWHDFDTRVWELYCTGTEGEITHWELRRRDGEPPVLIPDSTAALRATIERWTAEDRRGET